MPLPSFSRADTLPFQATSRPTQSSCESTSKVPRLPNRRETLLAGLAATGATIGLAGCKSESKIAPDIQSRTDVPLRMLWIGNDRDAAIIKRKWDAVAQQSLDVTVLELDRSDCQDIAATACQQAKLHDVIVYPMLAAAELSRQNALAPLDRQLLGGAENSSDDDRDDDASTAIGRLYPALRNGAAQFAGEAIGLPLGSNLPAVLSTEPIGPLTTWKDYDDWIAQLPGAKAGEPMAAEPLAPGWAAQMFLWRASTSINTPWLFGNENMQSLVDQNEYVAVLEQMKITADRYANDRKTPQQIWDAITLGELRGGIGWQLPSETDRSEVSVTSLPRSENQPRLLLDAFVSIISISSGCRQSAASNELLKWLSAGEGNESLQDQVSVMNPTRIEPIVQANGQAKRQSQYKTWLCDRLQTPLLLPTLQIVRGDRYYSVLDDQVTRCLDGKATAQDALLVVAKKWNQLTEDVGAADQQRAWRRAQGSRA